MNCTRRIPLIVTVLVVLLAAASLATWRTAAAPGQQAPMPGGPGFLMVSPYQLRPSAASIGWAYNSSTELYNPGPGLGVYATGLTLPNNVTITQLVVYFYDESAEDFDTQLLRCSPAGNGCQTLAYVQTSGSYAGYRAVPDASIDYALVDQQSYSYLVQVVMEAAGDLLRLAGVRIDYGYGTNVPLVLNDH